MANAVTRRRRDSAGPQAFTLVELMVSVAIIALLITLLIPAVSSVRTRAKVADTMALFATLTQGNEQFRGEQAIGGSYIPSATDSEACEEYRTFGVMANPFESLDGQKGLLANGANLLVYGLAGADGLGTAGFRDLSRPADGTWCDDLHDTPASGTNPDGAYALDPTTRDPLQTRYGPYIPDNAFSRIATFKELSDAGIIVGREDDDKAEDPQKVFVDAWRQPVLYYRARKGASIMVTNPTGGAVVPGVYDQRDNAWYTGSQGGGMSLKGINLGAGQEHTISTSKHPAADPKTANLSSSNYDNTFERFIWDRSVPQRNAPVNRETFLLISAGRDALYGTNDDVVNWTRDQ